MSRAEPAAMRRSTPRGAAGFAITFHCLPSQCSISVLLIWLPTAQTSLWEIAATASNSLWPTSGVRTASQRLPSQCSTSTCPGLLRVTMKTNGPDVVLAERGHVPEVDLRANRGTGDGGPAADVPVLDRAGGVASANRPTFVRGSESDSRKPTPTARRRRRLDLSPTIRPSA